MISVILPAYNEEKNIGKAIDKISDFFDKRGDLYEIIVINDGSKDKTAEVLENYKKTRNIIVVSHNKNQGYGSALVSGFKQAQGGLIFFTDSDLQFDIKDIEIFLQKIKDYDFAIGCRKNRKDSFHRILNAKIFGLMSFIFFGVKVKDVDCAFKLFKSYVVKGENLISKGALINLEILAKAKKRGYKFLEMPVNHFSRKEGKQTGGSFKVILRALGNFFVLWGKIIFKK